MKASSRKGSITSQARLSQSKIRNPHWDLLIKPSSTQCQSTAVGTPASKIKSGALNAKSGPKKLKSHRTSVPLRSGRQPPTSTIGNGVVSNNIQTADNRKPPHAAVKVNKETHHLTKEAILAGGKSVTQPSTSLLVEELYKQRQSSRNIIDEKNKVIADMARKLSESKLKLALATDQCD